MKLLDSIKGMFHGHKDHGGAVQNIDNADVAVDLDDTIGK